MACQGIFPDEGGMAGTVPMACHAPIPSCDRSNTEVDITAGTAHDSACTAQDSVRTALCYYVLPN